MSDAVVIFKDLPATFPEKDKYKKPSVIGSLIFHGLLVVVVLLVPLLLPQAITERELLVTLVSPIAPPPAPPPAPPAELRVATVPHLMKEELRPVTPDRLVTPVAIPRNVVKIVEEPLTPSISWTAGVPGGVPGGI